MTRDSLVREIERQTTIAQVLLAIGLSISPGNYRRFHRLTKLWGIDTSHFKGKAHGTTIQPQARTLSDILVEDGPLIASSALRKRLLKAKLLQNHCSKCGLGPFWQGASLVLQLDHVNGNPSDNRLENLRILCPNCHTQTDTFGRKRKNISGRYSVPSSLCYKCRRPNSARFELCKKCAAQSRLNPTKITWPDAETLEAEVLNTSYVAAARNLGVSDNAVRKYLKRTLGYAPGRGAIDGN